MKVVHISSFTYGGAANAAVNLHLALLTQGIDSHFLHLFPAQQIIHNAELYKPKNISEKLINSIRYRWQSVKNSHIFSSKESKITFNSCKSPYRFLHRHPVFKNADIINLHWIAGFVDYHSFFHHIKKKVVWTLHDENPYLGGLHYEFEGKLNNDASILKKEYKLIKAKKRLLEDVSIEVVGPSKWILSKAKKSTVLADKNYHHIPYGVEQSVFYPRNKLESRQKMGLPQDKFIILFVADSIEDERKGIRYLIESMQYLECIKDDFILCSVGKGDLKILSYTYRNFGYVSDREKMAELYSVADLFVIPSIADNLPNTILESLACGTPVLGFDTGGVPEMVKEGKTGFLVDVGNTEMLAYKIRKAIDNPSLLEIMSSQAVLYCNEHFSLEKQAFDYMKLYEAMMLDKS